MVNINDWIDAAEELPAPGQQVEIKTLTGSTGVASYWHLIGIWLTVSAVATSPDDVVVEWRPPCIH